MCSPPSELENENELTLAVKYSEWPPANWLHTSAKEEDWVSLRFGGDFHYPDKDTDLVKDHSVSSASFRRKLFFFELGNCSKFKYLPQYFNFLFNKLNFCCGMYSRADTI